VWNDADEDGVRSRGVDVKKPNREIDPRRWNCKISNEMKFLSNGEADGGDPKGSIDGGFERSGAMDDRTVDWPEKTNIKIREVQRRLKARERRARVSTGDHLERGRSVNDAIGILEGESPCLKDAEEFQGLRIGPCRGNSEERGIQISLSMGEVLRTSRGVWNVRSVRVEMNMCYVRVVMWIVLPRDHRDSSETVGTIDLEKLDFEAMRKFNVTELKVRSMNLSP
jgi:hypothetical protein